MSVPCTCIYIYWKGGEFGASKKRVKKGLETKKMGERGREKERKKGGECLDRLNSVAQGWDYKVVLKVFPYHRPLVCQYTGPRALSPLPIPAPLPNNESPLATVFPHRPDRRRRPSLPHTRFRTWWYVCIPSR